MKFILVDKFATGIKKLCGRVRTVKSDLFFAGGIIRCQVIAQVQAVMKQTGIGVLHPFAVKNDPFHGRCSECLF